MIKVHQLAWVKMTSEYFKLHAFLSLEKVTYKMEANFPEASAVAQRSPPSPETFPITQLAWSYSKRGQRSKLCFSDHGRECKREKSKKFNYLPRCHSALRLT